MSAATRSGPTAKGAAGRPVVILVRTKPGRTMCTETPVPAQRLAQALREPVEARLGRAVDEVGAPDPVAGDGGQHDDAAVPLPPRAVPPPRTCAAAGQARLTVSIRAIRSVSASSTSWCPSSPTATMTRSTSSPAASKHRDDRLVGARRSSAASKCTVSTWAHRVRAAAAAACSSAAPVAPGQDDRPAPVGGQQRRRAHERCPRSRRGRRPTGDDRRRRSSRDPETAGEVGGEHALGIDAPADRRPCRPAGGT